MPRSKSLGPLAKRRGVRFGGREVIRTPLVVPSFSSKGFPEVAAMLTTLEEVITECVLVSAYDVHYGQVSNSITFPEVAFLDSGGYESSKDTELSDLGYLEHHPKVWSPDLHRKVLENWNYATPTVLISYDHTKSRFSLNKQIGNARALFRGRRAISEILIKPETEEQRYIQIERVIKNVKSLKGFDIIGLTEKELGNTLLLRMSNIARLRIALDRAGMPTPIHIFGSLDTISTPLYFLAGADIFDGLTWLRFAYLDGYCVYMHDFAVVKFGPKIRDLDVGPRVWSNNYYALQEMQQCMRNYLNRDDFSAFAVHQDLFEKMYQSLLAEIAGGG